MHKQGNIYEYDSMIPTILHFMNQNARLAPIMIFCASCKNINSLFATMQSMT